MSPEDQFLEKKLGFNKLITIACHAVSQERYYGAIYMYLSAYDLALVLDKESLDIALEGLEASWEISLMLKSRPLAECVLAIFTQYKSKQELEKYSSQLNNLLLEKIGNLGKSVSNSQDNDVLSSLVGKVSDFIKNGEDSVEAFADLDLNDELGSIDKMVDKINKSSQSKALNNSKKNALADQIAEHVNGILHSAFQPPNNIKPVSDSKKLPAKDNSLDNDAYYIKKNIVKYENLVGYDNAIKHMRELGIGSKDKTQYMNLVEKLSKEHGLNRVSFNKTMVFSSPSRMDAKIFMEATAAELDMPIIHMHMEENIAGANVLCMMASADSNFRLNPARSGFNGKGILMLEDVDTWDFPEVNFDSLDGFSSFMNAQLSRGVAEVINLIEIAFEDPNILVLASVKNSVDEGKFSSMMFREHIDIAVNYPDEGERFKIWQRLANDHPSLRAFNLKKLVDYSSNMSRYDIEIAAHEALEEAYKEGIEKRKYIPLTISKIIEKLAESQPLDSREYKTLEDVATEDFKKDLENIDDILKN